MEAAGVVLCFGLIVFGVIVGVTQKMRGLW